VVHVNHQGIRIGIPSRKTATKACEAWDRSEQAREALAKHGMTYEDRFGAPRSRPEIAIERDSRLAFARLVRELGLNVAPPLESPPPALKANR
jgi:phage terminase small subunit